MENATGPKPGGKRAKRRGRGKVTPRVTLETKVLRVAAPAGSQFKGYEPYQVQDLVITARVVRYRRERWLTPDGETIVAPLPGGIRGHFGPDLRRFVLMQYHQGQSLPLRRQGSRWNVWSRSCRRSGSASPSARACPCEGGGDAPVDQWAGCIPRRDPRGAARRSGGGGLDQRRRYRRPPSRRQCGLHADRQ
jgi:hypothetical protein